MNEMSQQYRLQRMESLEGITLTAHTYNLAIGVTLMVGILIDLAMATYLTRAILSLPYILILIVYFVGSIGCSIVIYKSRSPVVSFLGFMGLSASMGLLLTGYLVGYSLSNIQSAFLLTGAVVVVMMVLATAKPDFFLSIGRGLGVALLTSLVLSLIAGIFFPSRLGILDYVVALIFSGYIGYDWARAQQYPKTLDNAVDSAADIYVDVVNLFIRILSILGRRSKD